MKQTYNHAITQNKHTYLAEKVRYDYFENGMKIPVVAFNVIEAKFYKKVFVTGDFSAKHIYFFGDIHVIDLNTPVIVDKDE